MTVPDGRSTAPPPITDTPWITHRWPTMASGPTTDRSTVARDATRAPGSRTEPVTVAPLLDHRAGPDHRLLDDGVVAATDAPGRAASGPPVELRTSTAADAPDAGPDGRGRARPRGRAARAGGRRGVEVGLQVGVGRAGVEPVGVRAQGEEGARPPTRAGKVSRSIDTRRSPGMRSRTEGSNT